MFRFYKSGGVIRITQERHRWLMLLYDTFDFCNIKREVWLSFALNNLCSGHTGNLCIHLIRGLKRCNFSACAAICKQDGLNHFIGAIGYKNLFWAHTMSVRNCSAQFCCRPIGISVPINC